MQKLFEIGDTVKNQHNGVGEVTDVYIHNNGENTYRVKYKDTGCLYWQYESDIALVKPKEQTMTKEEYVDSINKTLTERGNNYGEFPSQAGICQELKYTMRDAPNWNCLDADMQEALEMIQHKIARILNGNPNYHDSWHDISGYATLVADRLDK